MFWDNTYRLTNKVAGREVLTELVEQKPRRVSKPYQKPKSSGQSIYHELFSRAGITPATQMLAYEDGGKLADLERLACSLAREEDALAYCDLRLETL